MSHEEPTDLRVQRTHKFLQEAIIELINEKGFEAITVGDIAERAMINRATFYRHYQDKYDLVIKIFEETTEHLMEHLKPWRKKAGQSTIQDPPEIWVQVFEHVAQYTQLYRAMLGKNGSSWFATKMREHTIKLMLENEKHWVSRQKSDPAMPEELPAMQFSHVLIGTIAWWLESEKSYTPRQMAAWLYHFAFPGYLAALGYETPTLKKE